MKNPGDQNHFKYNFSAGIRRDFCFGLKFFSHNRSHTVYAEMELNSMRQLLNVNC